MESEQVFAPGSGLLSYETVVAHFGCALSLSPIDCLRQVPATTMKTFIEDASLFFPPVNLDGTQVSDSRVNILDGTFAKIPILIGTNFNEGRVFSAAFGFDIAPSVVNSTAAARQVLSVLLGGDNNALINNVINTALASYTADIVNVPYLFVAQIISTHSSLPTSSGALLIIAQPTSNSPAPARLSPASSSKTASPSGATSSRPSSRRRISSTTREPTTPLRSQRSLARIAPIALAT